ncbi:hypothetical protein QQS21_000333 [Conoideocrella luteorostrata]|uniref:Uncharacterized protein n=1 Tax=Conoideocrella luteorostrata TaxID=1105319 RepID=A0AAJ0D139_9HYPO|nr:hypothetical protein QQS21_000333 [Conoideocrella luteorostrata]
MLNIPLTWALLLAPAVFALPRGDLTDATTDIQPQDIHWETSRYWSYGSPGGSASGLSVSGPKNYYTGAPAFNVTCVRETMAADGWLACTPAPNHDAAGVVLYRRIKNPSYHYNTDIWVSHQYTYKDLKLNITGHNVRYEQYDGWETKKEMPVVSKELS